MKASLRDCFGRTSLAMTKMKKKITISIITLLLPFAMLAQNYPQLIAPGQPKTITTPDTVWVISNKQFNKALACGEKLKLADTANVLLEKKVEVQKKQLTAKDSTIKDTDGLYKHYLGKWETCDKDLEKAEIKIVKQKKTFTWIAVGTGIVSFVLGVVLIR